MGGKDKVVVKGVVKDRFNEEDDSGGSGGRGGSGGTSSSSAPAEVLLYESDDDEMVLITVDKLTEEALAHLCKLTDNLRREADIDSAVEQVLNALTIALSKQGTEMSGGYAGLVAASLRRFIAEEK